MSPALGKSPSKFLNRHRINKIRYVLEDVLPPVARDSKLFYGLMHVVFGRDTRQFTAFRPASPYMKDEAYADYYKKFPAIMENTDLNEQCIEKIISQATGDRFVDVGCGRGYFAALLAERTGNPVTGCDFLISDELRARYPSIEFVEGPIEKLPFKDKQFDTVICSHTLEHIIRFDEAIAELRRICRKRLILVVPREREYKYSFNLHVQFFPYTHTFLNRLHPLPPKHSCEVVDGDIFYVEDVA